MIASPDFVSPAHARTRSTATVLPFPSPTIGVYGPDDRAFGKVLDYIDYGIVCVTPTAFVEYCNRSARRMLTHCTEIALEDCHLVGHDRRETNRLHTAINSVAANGVPRLIALAGADGRMHLSVVPLAREADGGDGPGAAGVALFLGQPRTSPELSLHWYGIDHGLTLAERAVLVALSNGLEPGAVARACGVALSTVRTQIASIRGKTGSATIGALLREVAQLPPVLPPPRAGMLA